MSNPDLKPCPFCGRRAVLERTPGSYGYTSARVYVACSGCWAKTPAEDTEAWEQGLGDYTVEFVAKQAVTEMWNARAQEDAPE